MMPANGKMGCIVAVLAGGLLIFGVGCSHNPAGAAPASPAAARKAAAMKEYRPAAERVLGSESKVLLFGDLARDGHIQLLVINALSQLPSDPSKGVDISRAAVLEKDGNDWHEALVADNSLRNPQGYLSGTPEHSVNAWHLSYKQGKKGLTLYFTPLENNGSSRAIEIRWNRAIRRYQSMDRNGMRFLSESSSLGPLPSFRLER